MGTSALIGYEENEKYYAQRLSFDGFIEDTGKLLYDHYNSLSLVKSLLDHGGIVSLDKDIASTEFYNDGEPKYESSYDDLEEFFEEYNYFFTNGKWFVDYFCYDSDSQKYEDLETVLKRKGLVK